MKTIIALALLTLASCSTDVSTREKLLHSVDLYHHDLRWKRFDLAAEYLPGALKKRFLEKHERDREDLFIASVETRSLELDKEEKVADVKVEITWHRLPSTVMQRTTLIERWFRAERDWILVSQKMGSSRPSSDPNSDLTMEFQILPSTLTKE